MTDSQPAPMPELRKICPCCNGKRGIKGYEDDFINRLAVFNAVFRSMTTKNEKRAAINFIADKYKDEIND